MPVGVFPGQYNQIRAAKLLLTSAKILPNQPFQPVALYSAGNVFPRNHQAKSGCSALVRYRKHKKEPAGNLVSGIGKHGPVVFRPEQARRSGKP